MILTGLILFAAASSPTCQKLEKDFEENERFMAFLHDVNAGALEATESLNRKMLPYGLSPTDRAREDEARRKLLESDERQKVEGDRITALLIANKCKVPDHVTSWFTYSEKNPEAPKKPN